MRIEIISRSWRDRKNLGVKRQVKFTLRTPELRAGAAALASVGTERGVTPHPPWVMSRRLTVMNSFLAHPAGHLPHTNTQSTILFGPAPKMAMGTSSENNRRSRLSAGLSRLSHNIEA